MFVFVAPVVACDESTAQRDIAMRIDISPTGVRIALNVSRLGPFAEHLNYRSKNVYTCVVIVWRCVRGEKIPTEFNEQQGIFPASSLLPFSFCLIRPANMYNLFNSRQTNNYHQKNTFFLCFIRSGHAKTKTSIVAHSILWPASER